MELVINWGIICISFVNIYRIVCNFMHKVGFFSLLLWGNVPCLYLILFYFILMQPTFLTKEQRAMEALKRRQQQVEEQRKKTEVHI